MRTLDMNEVQDVSGGVKNLGASVIMAAAGGMLGFLLSGGNPIGAALGADLGYQYVQAL